MEKDSSTEERKTKKKKKQHERNTQDQQGSSIDRTLEKEKKPDKNTVQSQKAVADEGATRPMRSIESLELAVDESSRCALGKPYPYNDPCALETLSSEGDVLKKTYTMYRKRGVMALAFFKKLTALKQAVASLPKSTSKDDKLVIMFTNPKVPGFRSHEVLPAKRLDPTVSPLSDLPGIFIGSFDVKTKVEMSYAFVCSNQCFIAEHFMERLTLYVYRTKFQELLMKADSGSSLILFRQSKGAMCINLEFCCTGGAKRASSYASIPLLEAEFDIEHCIQIPVINDEYCQWIYIETSSGFMEKIAGSGPKPSMSSSQARSNKGKTNGAEEDEHALSLADCIVAFRLYENIKLSKWVLVVQTTHTIPGAYETVAVFADLVPRTGNDKMMQMEVGKRIFFSHVENETSYPAHDDKAATGRMLDGYVETLVCVTQKTLLTKVFSSSLNQGSASAIQGRRPVLMLPFAYDKSLFKENGGLVMNQGGSFMAVVQSWGVEEAPKSFEITKAILTREVDSDMYASFPSPLEIMDYSGLIDEDDSTDSAFS